MRDIGKNIRDLRTRQKMTQDELAEKLFVTRQTVSNYETGKSRPDVDMLVKIAEVLETDVNEILYGPKKIPDRKSEFVHFDINLGICIVLWWMMFLLDDITWELCVTSFHTFPRALLYWGLYPFTFFCSGYTLMQLLSLFTGLRPVKGKYVKWIRWGLLAVIIGGFLYLLPEFIDMIEGSIRYMIFKAQDVSDAFTYSGRFKATQAHMFLFRMLDNQPWILGLFGGALWLVQNPKNK